MRVGFSVSFIYLSMNFAPETRKDDLLEEEVVDEGDKNNVEDNGENQLSGDMSWVCHNMEKLLQELTISVFIDV